jgi:hypothetical protein
VPPNQVLQLAHDRLVQRCDGLLASILGVPARSRGRLGASSHPASGLEAESPYVRWQGTQRLRSGRVGKQECGDATKTPAESAIPTSIFTRSERVDAISLRVRTRLEDTLYMNFGGFRLTRHYIQHQTGWSNRSLV